MTQGPVALDKGCPSNLAPADAQGARQSVEAFVRTAGNRSSLDLNVRGAKCGGCIAKIEGAVTALPGITTARLNLSSGKMRIEWTGRLTGSDIGDAIADLGYGVSAFAADAVADDRKAEERGLLIAMGVAGFAAANIMLLSVSVWGGAGEMGGTTRQVFHAISGLIAFPVIVYSGRTFFRSAWNVLRRGRANMDVPISLAIILAFATSVSETITGGPHAYFDACVMLLFFLLVGRFLDARLRRQAWSAAHDLAALQGRSVTRIARDGTSHAVRASDIEAGDEVLLAPGERAVIDMTLVSGGSEVDESFVTGESLPRPAVSGSLLYAGSINLGVALRGRALAPASNSLLSDIADMLEAGEQRRSAYRKIADRAVSLYVPFVHTTAALTFVGWLFAGAGVREALLIAVSTLIITCPCALALAAPVVQVVASGKLFRMGAFLKSGDALERFAEVDHVVFDKTGTLTLGAPAMVSDSATLESVPAAAKLARASRHPLSQALVAVAGPGPVSANVKEHPGLGMEAEIDGVKCRLGSAEWVGIKNDETSGPVLWFSQGDAAPVCFRFDEQLRDDAIEAVRSLKDTGLSLEILSGDRSGAVARLSSAIGVERWTAGARPNDKVARLETLREQGRRVLMVGDGLNDAAALALAHASVTPGGAMDISQSASDAVFAGGLSTIGQILRVSKSARNVMRQNFALAAAYNLVAVPIAVTGHVTPLVAAIAMSASSLVVSLNALRLGPGSGTVT
jgi:P-type Cu2+ transporter